MEKENNKLRRKSRKDFIDNVTNTREKTRKPNTSRVGSWLFCAVLCQFLNGRSRN